MKNWRKNLYNAFIIVAAYLAVFLAGKFILNSNPGLSLLQWISDTNPMHHSYLFGWLVMHKRFLLCSIISILPSIWGWRQYSTAAVIGFSAGLLAGEIYHFIFWTPSQPGIPYSWCIWLICFVISILAGLFMEFRKNKA